MNDEPVQKPLQIALTLPGGASLGTFEAGAVCALLVTIQNVNAQARGTIIVDRIAGASAGALSGVLAARVLLTGEDPLPAFSRAWVASPTLRDLRARGPWAPMTLRRARAIAQQVITRPNRVVDERRQEVAIEVEWALTSLRGSDYCIQRVAVDGRERGPLRCTSHIDWSRHKLEAVAAGAAEPDAEWARAVDGAIASASHPLAFAPTLLDRTDLTAQYKANGVKLPSSGAPRLWYTDGGLVNNEPMGRALARTLPKGAHRMVLVVRSDARAPSDADDDAWTGAVQPRWTETLMRSVDVLATHSVGEDVRQAEKINRRVMWTRDAAKHVASLIEDDKGNLENLRRAYRDLKKKQDALRPEGRSEAKRSSPEDEPPEPRTVEEALARLLAAASGLEDKRELDVAVVTNEPRANASSARPAPGDVRLQLGGFLDRRRREYDFVAGYGQMLTSIKGELRGQLDDELLSDALDEARARLPPPRALRRMGRRRDRISLANRARLLGLSVRVGRITGGDAIAIRRNRRRDLLAAARARRTS